MATRDYTKYPHTCEQCGETFTVTRCELARNPRFCSYSCHYTHKRRFAVARECAACGASFFVPASRHRDGRGRFCSRRCQFAATPAMRLDALTEPHESGCLIWQGSTSSGYGLMRLGNKTTSAHRLAYEIAFGPIPDGMFVCHRCDNRRCCNPAHLFLGTHADNMKDMRDKGRGHATGPTGEHHGHHKLTATAVQDIRARHLAGATIADLAREFRVTYATVKDAVMRVTWRHI